jgi:hypothetical protein
MVMAPVLGQKMVGHLKGLQDEIRMSFGKDPSIRFPTFRYLLVGEEERYEHITLTAPFWAGYEEASAINLGLDISGLKHQPLEDIGWRCRITVGKPNWFRNKDEDILKFPVTSGLLARVASKLRREIAESDQMKWCYELPDNGRVNLHITICSGVGLYEKLGPWIESRNLLRKHVMRVRVPVIVTLAKYPHGWRMVSRDPAQEERAA